MKASWKVRASFINVGNGDAILIEAKDEMYEEGTFVMLIDGGSGEPEEYMSSDTGRTKVSEYLEMLSLHHIDIMVNTHIHEDHTCGLIEVVEKYKPREFWYPFPKQLIYIMNDDIYVDLAKTESDYKFICSLKGYKRLFEMIENCGGANRQITKGCNITSLPCGLKMRVIGPDNETLDEQMKVFRNLYDGVDAYRSIRKLDECMNYSSLCMSLEYNGIVMLLAGDTPEDGYNEIVKADVFKLGHHGQQNSISEELIELISPKIAIVSASSDRRYDSAHPLVLKLLDEKKISTFFTDCPNVSPYTDGLTYHHGVCIEFYEDSDIKAKYV